MIYDITTADSDSNISKIRDLENEESNTEIPMEEAFINSIKIKSVKQHFTRPPLAKQQPHRKYPSTFLKVEALYGSDYDLIIKDFITFDDYTDPQTVKLYDSTLQDFQEGNGCWAQRVRIPSFLRPCLTI